VVVQRDTCPPFGARTPALAPLVRSSVSSWTPRHPALTQRPSTLSLPLSRDSARRKRRRHCRRELRELLTPSPLRLASPPSVSKSASSSSIFSTPRLDEISPRWAAFHEYVVVGFTAVATPIPTNLAAASLSPPFFPLSHVKVYLGLGVGSHHAILALVPPSCGNTAAAPPCSPPMCTSHVSRLTEAIRVRRFYLGSSTLTHWCLSRPSPMLYRSEMAGVSQCSSVVPPWPTATPLRRGNPSVAYLHHCRIAPVARWCPWIRRRSSPSASIRRRRSPLLSGSLTRGSRCQRLNGLLSFIQIQIFGFLAKIISSVSEIQKLWNKFFDVPWDG